MELERGGQKQKRPVLCMQSLGLLRWLFADRLPTQRVNDRTTQRVEGKDENEFLLEDYCSDDEGSFRGKTEAALGMEGLSSATKEILKKYAGTTNNTPPLSTSADKALG